MTAALLFDGFYSSGPRKWEEWHAGVRMCGEHWHYVRYYPNGDWISAYRDHSFDFWAFTEAVTTELLTLAKRGQAPEIGDFDPLCYAGSYTLNNGAVIESFSPDMLGGCILTIEKAVQAGKLVNISDDKSLNEFLFSPQPA